MSLHKVDLNLFIVFEAIYNEGNLTRAADVLHLTQPAVSHALARLREQFADPLFVRKGSLMEPTARARSIVNDVRQSLQVLQNTLTPDSDFDFHGSERQFTFCLRDVLEATCLPQLLAYLNREAPNISIISQRLPRRDLESQLASGRLDFALDVLLAVSDDIHHELMSQDNLVVIARNNHPALHAGLDIYGYLSQQHILVSSRSEGPGVEDFELSRHGLQRQISLRCQHYYAAFRVVQQSNLLLTMPQTYARILNASGENTIYPMPVEIPPIDVHLYWHKNVEKDAGNRWLREKILELGASSSI
ncbi:MAG: LysR family transcriptional regulator [Pseudomonadales bacterium]|nr:LysR family transcriptional regulator [Pseudomonadales bacterium]